jgi:hypothetical protein
VNRKAEKKVDERHDREKYQGGMPRAEGQLHGLIGIGVVGGVVVIVVVVVVVLVLLLIVLVVVLLLVAC